MSMKMTTKWFPLNCRSIPVLTKPRFQLRTQFFIYLLRCSNVAQPQSSFIIIIHFRSFPRNSSVFTPHFIHAAFQRKPVDMGPSNDQVHTGHVIKLKRSLNIDHRSGDQMELGDVLSFSPPFITLHIYGTLTDMMGTDKYYEILSLPQSYMKQHKNGI